MPITPKPCKDCLATWNTAVMAGLNPPPFKQRPATPPGPRCATHHREHKKQQSSSAHAARVQTVYGLDDYDALKEFQGGVCAICRRATGATRRLSVDHNHKTGTVRGLLCRPCNDMLGHARDELDFFMRAHRYLFAPPYETFKENRGNE